MLDKKNILFIVSNAYEVSDVPCGVCLEEFAIPYLIFLKENFSITTASPKGGKSYISPSGLHNLKKEWMFAKEVLNRTVSIEDINEDTFDAAFFPGGQAAMVDLPYNPKIAEIIKKYCKENKPIGTLSHGLAAFIGVESESGEPLLKDKEVCPFSNREEKEQFQADVLPFTLEDKIKEQGAILKNGEPYIASCENLITGQNKNASAQIALKIIKMLQEEK